MTRPRIERPGFDDRKVLLGPSAHHVRLSLFKSCSDAEYIHEVEARGVLGINLTIDSGKEICVVNQESQGKAVYMYF